MILLKIWFSVLLISFFVGITSNREGLLILSLYGIGGTFVLFLLAGIWF